MVEVVERRSSRSCCKISEHMVSSGFGTGGLGVVVVVVLPLM